MAPSPDTLYPKTLWKPAFDVPYSFPEAAYCNCAGWPDATVAAVRCGCRAARKPARHSQCVGAGLIHHRHGRGRRGPDPWHAVDRRDPIAIGHAYGIPGGRSCFESRRADRRKVDCRRIPSLRLRAVESHGPSPPVPPSAAATPVASDRSELPRESAAARRKAVAPRPRDRIPYPPFLLQHGARCWKSTESNETPHGHAPVATHERVLCV